MEWTISVCDSGSKLLTFLKSKNHTLSTRQLKSLLESNQCTVNGRVERFGSPVLGTGDRVVLAQVVVLKKSSHAISFESWRILYEDENLFAYDKPAGIVCDDQGIGFLVRSYDSSLQLLHRLDRDTTGVLLFAKTDSFKNLIMDLFRKRQIQKTYLAIVDGTPRQSQGLIENYLGKKKQLSDQMIWGKVQNEKEGLFASTAWKSEKVGKNATLIRCFPKTGRMHQIRVHLSEMGHPILGDSLYGKQFRCSYRPSRCLLHALEISFINPNTNLPLVISAPLSQDFIDVLSLLGLSSSKNER